MSDESTKAKGVEWFDNCCNGRSSAVPTEAIGPEETTTLPPKGVALLSRGKAGSSTVDWFDNCCNGRAS